MTAVKVGRDDNIDFAIKKFLNKVKKSGLMDELQERKYFKKPSVKRNEQKRRRKRVLEKLKQEKALEKDWPNFLVSKIILNKLNEMWPRCHILFCRRDF